MLTTPGQLLVNDALPDELKNYGRHINKKSIVELLKRVLETDPDEYVNIVQKLQAIGKRSAHSGGSSFSLKDGFELTTDVKKIKLGNKELFSIENDLLLVCLDEKLDLNLFKEMKKLNPHVVIVLDKGFKDNDQLKTNAVQTLGKNSDEELYFICNVKLLDSG